MDITAFGELLIDFTDAGRSERGGRLFERNPGGAPANMLAQAAKMGASAALIAKVGDDMHGRYLKETLKDHGVDVSNVILDKDVFTTLAFVSLESGGERKFSFARKPGADTRLRIDEIDTGLLRSARVFHFGSLSLTDEPSRSATLYAVETARQYGAVISFDPNYREMLWSGRDAAAERIRAAAGMADIIKCSDEEIELISGETDPVFGSGKLLKLGCQAVVVTLGPAGALIRNKEGYVIEPGFETDPVDTTGAGDSFMGAFLAAFAASGGKLSELSLAELAGFARVGNAAASLCVRRRGGIPSLPDRDSVEALL